MKVLVISHTYIAKINREKWKVLAKQQPDLNLKVVFPDNWPDVLFELNSGNSNEDNLKNCEFISLPAFNTGNEILYGFYPKKLIKILKIFKPDLIHVEQGDNAFSYFQTILLSKIFSPKSKFSFFTWINWKPKTSLKYKLFWTLIERFNRFFSNGAIVGNEDAQRLLKQKTFSKPVMVLPQLGVDQNFFVPSSKLNNKYIGYVGRIEIEKGVLNLVDAFEKVSPDFSEWKLLFVGNGGARKNLYSYVLSKKLEHNVEFKDSVNHENVVSVLQSLDILVLPSYDTQMWREQFGHILIEAMSCNVPVIGSTGGEIANVISDAGLVFEQKNVEQLSSCLKRLMQDDNLREELGEKGFKRVQEHFSHQAVAKKTYEFWKSII
ncbi:MAG: glycosyltransferase family 4 protein [bacterium]